MSDFGYQGSSAPLVFVRTVGFSATDAMRLMQSAQRMSEAVRWRLAPPGVAADVYLAHANSIRADKATDLPLRDREDSAFSAGHSSTSDQGHLTVDENGLHKTRPVCVLGRASQQDDLLAYTASLVFPGALQELQTGLRRAENELVALRMMYVLGRSAWEERARWKTHRLQLHHGTRLVAVIEPMAWRAHLLDTCTVCELENSFAQAVPHSSGFAAPGFDALKLESTLWEFAKRCPEALLNQMVPTVYLRSKLTHRRPAEISQRDMGEHCVAVLRVLDTHSRTANELQNGLRLQRPALLRTLACLALIRAIRPESKSSDWLSWLPRSWRRKVFGSSGLF